MNVLKIVSNTKIQVGNLTTPDGTPYRGFKVTIGGVKDPSTIERTYEDIDKVFKANPGSYKVEEVRENGKFKSFIVRTQ